ncbi:aspartate aminotransferase family protein [Embleya sp. AB8]|uniref:aspartate aminotransferase family protein n=1 Tax=Embleya sp. AB8 TaxID=3156304 RepID=UPI003C778432
MLPDHSLTDLEIKARDHLLLHYTPYTREPVPVIVRGEGPYVWDERGRRYLDGVSGAYSVHIGHGRAELGEAAAKQAAELAYFPLLGHAHPTAIELGARLAAAAPGDLNRVFFTTGGSEATETALKLAKQYFVMTGRPNKYKVIGRAGSYHGSTHAAMAIGGVPIVQQLFEPLVAGARAVPNTNGYRSPLAAEELGTWAAEQIALTIELEGPDSVAAVFVEPVQTHGGALVPPPGYLRRLREICDAHDVLLIADEVVSAFGRLGHMFGGDRFGCEPDVILLAKGLTSGYAPLGAVVLSDRIAEPFQQEGIMFVHGYTFGGHPLSTAVALANLDVLEREGLFDHVLANEGAFRATLEKLYELPIVGDIRGTGYLYGIELVKDRATKETFDGEECQRLLAGHLSRDLYAAGLHCRVGDREAPVIVLAPPLICTQQHFDEMEHILRAALTDTWNRL